MVGTDGTPVYSEFGNDPDLGELVEMFVEEMPDRIASVEQAYSSRDMESLRRVAHQLKGSAGSYGFDQLTPYAMELESAVRDGEPEEAICKLVVDLVNICQRVQSGAPS